MNIPGTLEFNFNIHAIIVLLGGIFIIYTATKEILHMMAITEVTPMTKATFYFVIVVLACSDVVQIRYQRKILRQKQAMLERVQTQG